MRPIAALTLLALLASCGNKNKRPENSTCHAPDPVSGGGGFDFEPRFEGVAGQLADTVSLTWSSDLPGWWYVVEQDGRILRFAAEDGVSDAQVVLDLRDQVERGSETGLLGLAFHPDFAGTGAIYVNYTSADGGLHTRISRFTSTDDGASFGGEEIVFTQEQPFSNHNAGHLAFGPDGYLYFGLGDGGSGGDPLNAGQDLDTALGKMLRIDVDGGTPYGIPGDNPFADGGGAPEIYAWGLRNPWRFSFDSGTGVLWLGDVGQNDFEEVDRIERGGNYGWRITEGRACYEPADGCDRSGLVPPVAVYANEGGASVVGGIVYRGSEIPGLVGTYLYSDFYTGAVYAAAGDEDLGRVGDAPGRLAHWEQGPDGEAWALGYDGQVYTLVPSGKAPSGGPPERLSRTGCVNPANPSQPAEGVVAYDVAHPFWSDRAEKRRWLAIPDGAAISVGADDDLDLPPGSVLLKEMKRGGERIETRMMVRHEDGSWAGYSYRWRADQSDADLLPSSLTVQADGPWTIPSRDGCMQCHTEAAGGSLSLELGQLGEQATELAALGMLDGVDPKADPPASWPAVSGGGSVEERARTYLHVNCSSCHRPDGGTRTDLDLRRSAPAGEELGLCVAPNHGELGLSEPLIVAPGEPGRSVLLQRMSVRDANQMPPLATHEVDEVGAQLLTAWINGLSGCP